MRKLFVIAIGLIVLCGVTTAQNPIPNVSIALTPHSTITVQIQNLGCTTTARDTFEALTWSSSAQKSISNAGGAGGTRSGATSFSELLVTRHFDECSAELFLAVAKGTNFHTVTITQEAVVPDSQVSVGTNSNSVTEVTLTDVYLTSFQLGGSEANATPSETIGLNFSKMCIRDTSRGASPLCYDLKAPKA